MTAISGSLIAIYVELKSQTDELVIIRSLRISPESSGVAICDSTGKALEPLEEFRERDDEIRSGIGTAIPAGRSVTEPVLVSKWFDLRKPGPYSLQVRIKDPITKTIVESNRLTITVLPNSP